MIVVEQIRAARAMLGIKQGDLAKRAGISVSTLNNIERGVQTDPKISTMRAIQHALEQEGIEFSGGESGRIGLSMQLSAQDGRRGTLGFKSERSDAPQGAGQGAAGNGHGTSHGNGHAGNGHTNGGNGAMRSSATGGPVRGGDILIIDDHADDREMFKGWLRQRHGKQVRILEAATARDGSTQLRQEKPRMVLLTDRMYGVHGLQFLADLQRDKINLPVMIVVTVNEDPAVERALRAQGVERIIPRKELTRDRLYALLDSVPQAQAA